MGRPFVQLLSTGGDGTGTTNAVTDTSSTPASYEFKGPTGYDDYAYVERILVYMADTTAMGVGYASGSALTNGIELAIKDSSGNVIVDLTPAPVKTNADWQALCYDVEVKGFGADYTLSARWTFSKFVPGGLALNDGTKLSLTCNDDMTGIDVHRFTVQGWRTDQQY